MSSCQICGKWFSSNQSLVQHTESSHGRAGVYRGVQSWEKSRRQTGQITTGVAAQDYQYEVDSDMYDYETDTLDCGMCSKYFSTARGLEQHLNSGVHEQKRYECQECGKTTTSLAGLTQHLEATGHARKESRLVDVMLTDAQQHPRLMLTNGPAPRLYHECTLYFDGSARPNPNDYGGCGWYLVDHRGREMTRGGETVYPSGDNCNVTCNQAEYQGLINGLQAAIDEGVRRIKVRGDSQLVINQMTGEYKCNAKLRPLRDEALELAEDFQDVDYEWIDRSENTVADELAKQFS